MSWAVAVGGTPRDTLEVFVANTLSLVYGCSPVVLTALDAWLTGQIKAARHASPAMPRAVYVQCFKPASLHPKCAIWLVLVHAIEPPNSTESVSHAYVLAGDNFLSVLPIDFDGGPSQECARRYAEGDAPAVLVEPAKMQGSSTVRLERAPRRRLAEAQEESGEQVHPSQ